MTRNRGKEGSDDRLFGDLKMQESIIEACKDLRYLFSRGFAEKSAVELVGNRYKLNARQQKALRGMGASEAQIERRKAHVLLPSELQGKKLMIDGFNLLIILESALSEAYLFKGLDDCYRDLSGVHGTYKRVQKTEEALLLIGTTLTELGVVHVHWVFDKPVSNSGRIKTMLRELAERENFPWEISLDNNPDKVLAAAEDSVVVSSDAWILDRAKQWFNLAAILIEDHIESAFIVQSQKA